MEYINVDRLASLIGTQVRNYVMCQFASKGSMYKICYNRYMPQQGLKSGDCCFILLRCLELAWDDKFIKQLRAEWNFTALRGEYLAMPLTDEEANLDGFKD